MPACADALAELPDLLAGRDRDDVADDFVAGDARILYREPNALRRDLFITDIRVRGDS